MDYSKLLPSPKLHPWPDSKAKWCGHASTMCSYPAAGEARSTRRSHNLDACRQAACEPLAAPYLDAELIHLSREAGGAQGGRKPSLRLLAFVTWLPVSLYKKWLPKTTGCETRTTRQPASQTSIQTFCTSLLLVLPPTTTCTCKEREDGQTGTVWDLHTGWLDAAHGQSTWHPN